MLCGGWAMHLVALQGGEAKPSICRPAAMLAPVGPAPNWWRRVNDRLVDGCRRDRVPCNPSTPRRKGRIVTFTKAPACSPSPDLLQQLRPSNFIGSIELKHVEGERVVIADLGKGRAVYTTQAVPAGDLLMCVAPVAFVDAPPGHGVRPDGEALVDAIIDRRLWATAWFQALYDGSPASCTTCPDIAAPPDALPPTPASLPAQQAAGFGGPPAGGGKGPASRKSKVKRGRSGAGPGASPAALLKAAGLDRKALRRIAETTKLNCFGDNHEDLALCELRGEAPRGHIGVWGPFAMLNHSCAPSAINYVVGDSMVVRAAISLPAGAEVTISYLGRPQLAPVGARHVSLHSTYGFECSCERCTLELQHVGKLDTALYEELHVEAGERMRAQFRAAVEQDPYDEEELTVLRDQIQSALLAVTQTFRSALVSPRARLFISASLYEAYELLIDICTALGQKEDRIHLLGQVLRFLEAVTPGSDLHVITASTLHAEATALLGEASPQAQAALAAARTALIARYGPDLTDKHMHRLMQLNRDLYG